MTRTNVLTGLVLLLCAAVLALAIAYGNVIGRVDGDQQANTHALCALRSDLQTRVTSAEQFLLTHPHGILGISAAEIRSSLDNEQSTIRALSSIDCPRPVSKKPAR